MLRSPPVPPAQEDPQINPASMQLEERRRPARRVRRRSRRDRRTRLVRGMAIAAFALAVLALLSLVPTVSIQRELLRAKDAMDSGSQRFFAGDLPAARRHFDEAAAAFVLARTRVNTPLLNLAATVPLLGRTADSIEAMAVAGAGIAGAAGELAQSVGRLGGLGSLAPTDGRISIETLAELEPVLESVRDAVEGAAGALDAAEAEWVLPPVAAARAEFEAPLERLSRALRGATGVAAGLPDFLGARGLRRYFVAAQNPAELRGTGGFIGSYAILRAYKGAVEFSPFRPIDTLPDAVGEVQPPSPEFAERFDDFGGAGYWRNINVTADLPSAAVAIERLYRHVKGVRLDGVIAATPQALEALLEVTGPVDVPSLQTTIDADGVVEFVTNSAYRRITGVDERKRVLGDAAKATFDRFVDGTRNPVNAVRVLARAVADGHLALHAARDAELQAAFEDAAVAGALEDPEGDFVAVSATNGAANKLDFYVRRTLDYDVRLHEDGSATTSLTIRLRNDAPTSGEPVYVIGPGPGSTRAGRSVSFLSVYCAPGCELGRHTVDGEPEPVGVERELGRRVFSEYVRVDSGETRSIGYELRVPDAWSGDSLSGTYRLTMQGQPSTIQPTAVSVTVHPPPGASVSGSNLPVEAAGRSATWRGPAGKAVRLEVEFRKPLLTRAWTKLIRFFTRPLLESRMVSP